MGRTSLAIGLAIIFICCERDNTDIPGQGSALVITIGTTCGWCAGTDSLVIRKDSSLYVYISPCDDKDYSVSAATGNDEWVELNDLLDFEAFEKITINTCYVCADGCDTWISVRNDSASHRIRFGYQDSLAIQTIRPFADKLDDIRLRFRQD